MLEVREGHKIHVKRDHFSSDFIYSVKWFNSVFSFSVDGAFAVALKDYCKSGVYSDARDVLNGRQDRAEELQKIMQQSMAEVTK